ncbi:GAP family protein [Arthrobacter sp. Sa2BUA2]|uniref:GAP family protein n=1 Tax=Arthrobacter pullicola TaxID=2762224 RepID=A0ABR8YG41_9MICC|nr:GAP family protein [Arthrobacter pullicola]MBD8043189.1 GAP family protein [Arthrobacter pullicola]
MTLELLAQLAILALIDSTSIGTLVIPVWLLLRPGARRTGGKVAVYLGAVGVFYFLVGLVLLSGATGIAGVLGGGSIGSVLELPAVQAVMVAAGAGMLIWSFKDSIGLAKPSRTKVPAAGSATVAATGTPPTASPTAVSGSPAVASGSKAAAAERSEATERRWQHRIGRALDTRGGLLGLAVLAGLLELPTMLPYLAAVGLLTGSGTEWQASAGLLGLYCLVMLLPAGLLLTGRLLLGRLLDSPLERLGAWLSRVSGEAVLWVVGIVGFLILRAGLSGLFPGAAWNPFG